MTTNVTIKGQVTIPKAVRKATGIGPGDPVDVCAAANGTIVIKRPGTMSDYKKRLYALANRRLIRGATTDEIMLMTRGDPDDDYKPQE